MDYRVWIRSCQRGFYFRESGADEHAQPGPKVRIRRGFGESQTRSLSKVPLSWPSDAITSITSSLLFIYLEIIVKIV